MTVRMILIFALVILFSCDETAPDESAVILTLDELRAYPGYSWFDAVAYEYAPDADIVQQIKNTMETSDIFFWIYSKPACSCEETQRLFPYAMKILQEASVSADKYQLLSMNKSSCPHPHEDALKVNFIPAFYCVGSDSIPKYSVFDSLFHFRIVYPDSTFSIEEFILESIK